MGIITKLIFGAFLSVTILTALGGGYMIWKNTIEQNALLRFNQQQLEQVIAENKKFQDQVEQLQKQQEELTAELQAKNDQVDKLTEELMNWLNSSDIVGQDRESSEILKETLRRLHP